MSPSQAKSTFHNIIQEAKKESLKEDSPDLPKNVGDFILAKESSDEKIRSIVAKKRNEGVRDQDIRWWFNMCNLETKILLKVDDVSIRSLFAKFREHGLSEDKAEKEMRKRYPLFGILMIPHSLLEKIGRCRMNLKTGLIFLFKSGYRKIQKHSKMRLKDHQLSMPW